jgi:hypothetical protein
MPDDPKAPRNLDKLLGNVIKYIRDDVRGKIPRRVKPVEHTVPRQVCKICVAQFDFITVKIQADRSVEGGICPDCQKHLDDGEIGCIQGTRYAFIKPTNNRLADLKGKVIKVTKPVMDLIQKQSKPKGGVHAD